jgi:hypothetical protein
MPRGLKETSSIISIGADVVEAGANTFTTQRVDLQLNPLDNEVFVVYAVDLDCLEPNNVAGVTTQIKSSISSTQRTTVGDLSDSNVLAINRITIQNDGVAGATRGSFASDSAPGTQLDYLAIISTNDFFLNIEGGNNTNARSATCRVYGVRATASSSIYAALVQSELLSA